MARAQSKAVKKKQNARENMLKGQGPGPAGGVMLPSNVGVKVDPATVEEATKCTLSAPKMCHVTRLSKPFP